MVTENYSHSYIHFCQNFVSHSSEKLRRGPFLLFGILCRGDSLLGAIEEEKRPSKFWSCPEKGRKPVKKLFRDVPKSGLIHREVSHLTKKKKNEKSL